jgi:polysaccharide biosynthesis protein PslG
LSRPTRLVIVLAIAAGLVALAVALVGGGDEPRPQAAATDAELVGMIDPGLVSMSPAEVGRTLDANRRLHVGLLRQTFDWAEIERAPGRYDFSRYDTVMAAAAARGLHVLPVLFNPPGFHSSGPPRPSPRGTFPPRRPADLGVFAAVVARRYGPQGSFWRAHPALTPDPIRAWQVWNEPSLPAYWPTGPDPKAYARLLAATASAIRHVDPRATIVSAGLPQTRIGVPFDRYAEGLYRAGAAASFDVLAIHPYARDPAGVLAAVEQARQLMDRHGDHSPIWVTEVGWASAGPPSDFTVGPRGQAARIRALLPALAARRERLGLRGVVYFGLRDSPRYPGSHDFWGLHTGLLTLSGRAKPAFAAFENAARLVLSR